jgi:cob(I)alamin adenosyltransferase
MDVWDAELPALRQFVLPGGTRTAAALHLARCVCRRAERRVVALAAEVEVSPATLAYLNRLSDFLFLAARLANHRAGKDEVVWDPARGSRP